MPMYRGRRYNVLYGSTGSTTTNSTGAYDDIPNIVALYSFRRCLSSYTSNLLRLRNNDTQAEEDFGALSNGDLDTDAISTFLGGATGTVVTWYDQSGNADDVTQATAAAQPTYDADEQNGHSVVRFPGGSNKYLRGVFSAGLSQPLSVLVTGKLSGSTTNGALIDSDDSSNRLLLDALDNGSAWRLYCGASLTGGTPDLAWHIFTALANGASSELWVDTGSVASGDAGAHNADGITIGDNSVLNDRLSGQIAEIVIADPSWSTADRQAAETAANDYWSVF